MRNNIEGKVIIGASSGLREATARLLSAESTSVVERCGGDALWPRYDAVRPQNQYRPGPRSIHQPGMDRSW